MTFGFVDSSPPHFTELSHWVTRCVRQTLFSCVWLSQLIDWLQYCIEWTFTVFQTLVLLNLIQHIWLSVMQHFTDSFGYCKQTSQYFLNNFASIFFVVRYHLSHFLWGAIFTNKLTFRIFFRVLQRKARWALYKIFIVISKWMSLVCVRRTQLLASKSEKSCAHDEID